MTTVVVLAAGKGTRFGGVKQLASVGPDGEAILDFLLQRACAAGFHDAIVVVSRAVADAMREHLRSFTPSIPVELALQPEVQGRDRPLGTAHAVLSCRDTIDGPFSVVNADDLYPARAFELLASHLARENTQALVAFPLKKTIIGRAAVKRALLDLDASDQLQAIRERSVDPRAVADMPGSAWCSMNMWGFEPSVFSACERAVREFLAEGRHGEVLLPDVVNALVQSGETVRVLRCDEPCIGITHADDLPTVRASLT